MRKFEQPHHKHEGKERSSSSLKKYIDHHKRGLVVALSLGGAALLSQESPQQQLQKHTHYFETMKKRAHKHIAQEGDQGFAVMQSLGYRMDFENQNLFLSYNPDISHLQPGDTLYFTPDLKKKDESDSLGNSFPPKQEK